MKQIVNTLLKLVLLIFIINLFVQITYAAECFYDMNLKKGWNLVALPLIPENQNIYAIVPEAEIMYEYKEGSYKEVHILKPGIGYWVKVNEDLTTRIHGECYGLLDEEDPTVPDKIKDGIHWNDILDKPNSFLLEENDPTVPSFIKDGITWNEISLKPTLIEYEKDPNVPDYIKDGISWNELQDIPTDIYDGDDIGIQEEVDPQIGNIEDNFIPKWNGSQLITGTIFDNGSIGIGTSSPNTKLHILGGSLLIENQNDQGNWISAYNSEQSWGAGFQFYKSTKLVINKYKNRKWNGHSMIWDLESGNIGINTTVPTAKLHIANTEASLDYPHISLYNIQSNWKIYQSSGKFFIGHENTNHLTIDGIKEYIGIGTTQPQAKLEIKDGSVYPKSTNDINSSPSDFTEGLSMSGGYNNGIHYMLITFKDSRGLGVFQIKSNYGINKPKYRTNANTSFSSWTEWNDF